MTNIPPEKSQPSSPIPVAPSLESSLAGIITPDHSGEDERRIITISGLAILVAFGAAFAAQILTGLIGFVTNLAFYGRVSTDLVSPADNHLGPWVILIPVLGALVVGVMARYGSSAIRGHGIPEAMEQVLHNQSRIPPRIMLLKPVSAAIAIGTGGPFGAEGPIIATGGALGSVLGQFLHITANERKVLLAAGAAAGMSATFGSPVAAVLLAIELLLFEYRPRSLIPVSLASATAAGVRIVFEGAAPVFPMGNISAPGGFAIASYIILGALVGLAAVFITRGLYAVEEGFERLPIHWMWWPALGAIVVGVVGWIAPRTLGVGYNNIGETLNGTLVGKALLVLVIFKLISWTIALGSGTSGGTLAPLFTIGGGIGALLGRAGAGLFPGAGIDFRIAALVGMAAIFAGASRALLTSVVFAFEVTRQPLGLLPLLAGCSAAYLVSLIQMKHTIMTEKLARRGTPVQQEFSVDHLDQILVQDIATEDVITLSAAESVESVRNQIVTQKAGFTHQGYPVVTLSGQLLGVVTVRDIMASPESPLTLLKDLVRRAPIVAFTSETAREAADKMVAAKVGRLPVVNPAEPGTIVGIITRSDLLEAHERRLHAENQQGRNLAFSVPQPWRNRPGV
ncbi:MAG: chloride channel protein [Gemmatimonadota bacterium]